MLLISLVGEQPAPNLLPARQLRPDATVLVYTTRTESTATNLKYLLSPQCHCLLCKVDPYHLPHIHDQLEQFIIRECPDLPLVFNLTGGTKPMVLAAYQLARKRNSPFVYFQTEGNTSYLYHYVFMGHQVALERVDQLPQTISLDDYLRLYLQDYEAGTPRDALEQQVFATLNRISDLEILTSVRPQGLSALEVDFAVRYGNQVGIGEIKSKGAKSGIDQINAVAHPHYLGTYVRKFLISAHPVDQNNLDLAAAYRIKVIELPSYARSGKLDAADQRKLRQGVVQHLGGSL